jgi:hypothetical protein
LRRKDRRTPTLGADQFKPFGGVHNPSHENYMLVSNPLSKLPTTRKCLCLQYGGRTPVSKTEIARERERKRKMERDRKRMSPGAFEFCYAEIRPMSPKDLAGLCGIKDNA